MNPILLDTHAAIWAASGKLATRVTRAIDEAAGNGELLLSPISAWEIGMLTKKGRLSLISTAADYVNSLFSKPGVVVASLTHTIAVASTSLPGKFLGDPADRILIATAASYGADLVTRDKEIHRYAKATAHVRCIPC